MGVFRIEKNSDYTVMSNYHFKDKRISLKAKGLLSQMLSLPEDWDYSLRGLAAINKECKDTIGSIVNELIDAGYIVREQIKDNGGKFADVNYVVYEYPISMTPDDDNLKTKQISESKNKDVNDKNGLKSLLSPCPKSSDTVSPDTDFSDTESSDANKINNNKILNNQILNNICLSENNNTRDDANLLTDGQTGLVQNHWENFKLSPSTMHEADCQHLVEKIKLSIDYDDLITQRPNDIGKINGLIQIILENLLATSATIKVGRNMLPNYVVKNVFLSIKRQHIEYVLQKMESVTTEIEHVDEYLKVVLYESVKNADFSADNIKQASSGVSASVKNKVHNFDERSDTDWDALELKLLKQG